MFVRFLNTPLNEIWDRKKEGSNYFPGWKVCLAYAYFFHWFQAGYAYKRYTYKKNPCISIALKVAYNKNKLHKTLDYWYRDVLNFDFLEKGLGIVSPPHFVYDFSTKMFLMLYPINWLNFIVWLPLLLEILRSICIAIVC